MSQKRNKEGGKQSRFAQRRAKRKAAWAQKTKKQRIRIRTLQVLSVIALVIVLSIVGLKWYVQMPELPTFDGDGDTTITGQMPGVSTLNRRKGVYTFLVVGQDVASGSTDTMLLLTYDTNVKTIHGLNLPRDTMVNVDSRSKRLNAVYSYNKGKDKKKQEEKGIKALKMEVGKLTGIIPDFYVMIEWEAVGELVDALGGVEFEVPFDMDYDDPAQNLHIHQKAGLRKLNGDDAMQVIRHRKNNDGSHSGGDLARMKVQQSFLMAVAEKCLQPSTFLRLPELVKVFSDNVKTDLSVGNVLALAQKASGMDAETGVVLQTAPIGASVRYNGASMVTLDPEELLEVLNNGMNPYNSDIELKDLQVVYQQENGRLAVTSGKLADGLGSGGSSSNKPKPSVPDKQTKPSKPVKPEPVKPKPSKPEPVKPKPEPPKPKPEPPKPEPPKPEPPKPEPPKPEPPKPEPPKPEPPKPEPPKPEPPKPEPPKPEPPKPDPEPVEPSQPEADPELEASSVWTGSIDHDIVTIFVA